MVVPKTKLPRSIAEPPSGPPLGPAVPEAQGAALRAGHLHVQQLNLRGIHQQ